MISPWLNEILRCPTCGEDLHVGDLIAECVGGHSWPVQGGVLNVAPRDSYVGSFGYQWTVFDRLQLDVQDRRESENTLRTKTGLLPEEVEGKVVLDAGCGMGRFTDVLSRWGADGVVGVDLSDAAYAARRNIQRDNVSFIRADLRSLPFRARSFDLIVTLGVLHHTPSTRDSLEHLLPFLRPGGTIALWVYDRRMNRTHAGSRVIRPITSRMDPDRLLRLVRIAVPRLHALKQHLPSLARRAMNFLIPCSEHPDPEWRVLNTYDWYSPRYQWKHSYAEVEHWLEGAGLVHVQRLPFPVALRGQAPP